MRLVKFVITKVAAAVVTLLVISAAVFFSIQLLPGGYVTMLLGTRATPEARAAANEKYGLDRPVIEQYFTWLGNVLHGDLGTSLVSGKPVSTELALRLPPTLELVFIAILIALVGGLLLGSLAGLFGYKKSVRDSTRVVGTLAMSVPDFVVGTVLVYLFSINAWGLTVGGYKPFELDPAANLRSIILPAFTLGLFGVALLMRTTRDSIANVLTQPFVTAAIARGDAARTVVAKHVARNAVSPVVTIVAVMIGAFLGGTVIAETLFSVPGIGLYFANSVRSRDFAPVQAIVLLSATVFIVANMLVDILYAVIDPRVTASKASK